MASEQTQTAVERYAIENTWTSAIVAGLIGGILFGLLMQFTMDVLPVIGALYGVPGLVPGWIAHLFHSAVFGLIYAAIVQLPALSKYADGPGSGAVLGAAFGVVVWIVAAGIVMPIWMGVVGLDAPPIPNLNGLSFVGHLVYGIALGAVFGAITVRRR